MSDWKHYRKTSTIEACLLTDPEDVPPDRRLAIVEDLGGTGEPGLHVSTLEGNLQVPFPTYLAKGVEGELYPVHPDIFEKTYVEDDPPTCQGCGAPSDRSAVFMYCTSCATHGPPEDEKPPVWIVAPLWTMQAMLLFSVFLLAVSCFAIASHVLGGNHLYDIPLLIRLVPVGSILSILVFGKAVQTWIARHDLDV